MHPLKRFIKKHNLNNSEFVRKYKIDLTPECIGYFINGKRTPRKKSALEISKKTGIPPEHLVFPENYN